VIHHVRLIPFGVRTLVLVLASVLAPMLPVVLIEVPVLELVSRFSAVTLGR
jgi:hypothetical protein